MRYIIAAYAGLIALLLALASAGAVVVYDASGPSGTLEGIADRYSFNLATWEVRHFPEKWLYKIGSIFQDRSSDDEAALTGYFSLVDDIQRRQEAGPSPELEAAERERAQQENRIEDIIEGRATAILKDQRLVMDPPPFTDLGLVFPPVDFELDSPPRVLAVSPRDHIELAHSYLLSPGLSLGTAVGIEKAAETADDSISALVVDSGGLGAYPSIVSEQDSYDSLIDTVFHEWLHEYLIFFPLGSRYFSGSELRTLNESVANLGGHALARLYFRRYGHLAPESAASASASASPSPAPAPSATAPPFDFTKEMRALRVQVEALLAAGKVQDAEQLMNEKREYFQTKGVYIRRLNQAYFAFHGSYADTPGSVDPIGPKLQTLLDRAGSPGAFILRARTLTSAADLDAALQAGGG